MNDPRQSISPLRAVRMYCLLCCNGSAHEVTNCIANEWEPSCSLWPIRFGHGIQGRSTLKAIRAKCLDCSACSPADVHNCKFKDCPLWPYRFGKNPNLKGKGRSSEQMSVIRSKISRISQKPLAHGAFQQLTLLECR